MRDAIETCAFRAMLLVLAVSCFLVWPFRCQSQDQSNVVRIRVAEGGGSFSCGSGTLIGINEHGHGVILTCWHLFRESDGPNYVDFPSGERRGATLVRAIRDDDLAVLIIANPPSQGTPLSESDMPRGSQATIAGYGGQGQYLAQRGSVTAFACFNGRTSEARVVTVQARQGDSGGPIFDADGKVCGVISCAGPGETLGTCGSQVWKFMQSCGPYGCPTYGRPRLVPVLPPRIAPRPTAPLPILKEPHREKPFNGNSAGVELTPARPLTPWAKAEDIQELKQAVSDLSKAVEAGRCKCDQSKPQPTTPEQPEQLSASVKAEIARLRLELAAQGRCKSCECDPEKIAAAVLAKIKFPSQPKPSDPKRHIVVVANQQAATWPRLKDEIQRAQQAYSGIVIAPPPSFATPLPQLVAFENGVAVKVISGQRGVSDALSHVARGEASLFPGE